MKINQDVFAQLEQAKRKRTILNQKSALLKGQCKKTASALLSIEVVVAQALDDKDHAEFLQKLPNVIGEGNEKIEK